MYTADITTISYKVKGEDSMKFYTKRHRHYCGIDLHARSMFLFILNDDGQVVFHKDMKTNVNRLPIGDNIKKHPSFSLGFVHNDLSQNYQLGGACA